MKKKLSFALTAMLAVGTMVGGVAGTSNVAEAAEASTPTYKVLQDRVIELTYDTYDFEAGAQYLTKYDPMEMGGCSAVKTTVDGDVYVGRNYDFYCSDAPAFVVRNNAGKIKTIGIGNMPLNMSAWTNAEDYTLPDNVLLALPYSCCDVMSETGIYAETNVRMYEKGLNCISTNPGKERRCTQAFMQTMLTQYATIDEILAHLNDYDWYDLTAMGFEQSFMLTDQSGRSVVVEFGANKVMWQESDYNANFFLNDELYEKELYPLGELRIAHELAYLPYVRTEDDIFTMMEQGAYNQFYTADVDPMYAAPEFFVYTGYNKYSYVNDPAGCAAATAKLCQEYGTYDWEKRVSEKTWESTFITAANVTDKYLHVHFSEHYGIDFTVTFE